jgi:hypothetical protein
MVEDENEVMTPGKLEEMRRKNKDARAKLAGKMTYSEKEAFKAKWEKALAAKKAQEIPATPGAIVVFHDVHATIKHLNGTEGDLLEQFNPPGLQAWQKRY